MRLIKFAHAHLIMIAARRTAVFAQSAALAVVAR